MPPPASTEPKLPTAALAALGIVYGDLGTSPLYTYQTIVAASGGHPTAPDAIGLLSLVVWALLITVSLKYCVFVMRADNHGEGGILALMSLVTSNRTGRATALLIIAGLAGAALIYGDGVITPAISVLSALEGLTTVTTTVKPFIMPAALVILILLFAAQRRGTSSIGRVFGPIMLMWFATIALLGLLGMLRHPAVLAAINPLQATRFLARHGWHSFIVLGGVFLAITGGEALYADMGHLGRTPIRTSWYAVVLPSLLLSYAGQTALIVTTPTLTGNPFFGLAPHWAIIPFVALATCATIIASQAIITGAFSLTRQAMQLGWLPGLTIKQTDKDAYGQIYVPLVNWALMAGTLALTAGFGSSARLAGAYGTAVSTTMLLTTALLFNAMKDIWRWPVLLAGLTASAFLLIDLTFFAANLLKIAEGGWIPLTLGALIFTLMRLWRGGLDALRAAQATTTTTPAAFLAQLQHDQTRRVPGTAVFLSRSETAVPPLLLNHVAQMKALQQVVVSLTIWFEQIPRIAPADRATTEDLGGGLFHVTLRFGFVDRPNLTAALAYAKDQGCPLDLHDAVYFVARDSVAQRPTRPRLPAWRRLIFSTLYRNAVRAADRFDLPADRLIEVGRQIQL